MTGEARDAREHLEGREVQIGALHAPRPDDAVDFVGLLSHGSIIDGRAGLAD
jgi:hypothetical protein